MAVSRMGKSCIVLLVVCVLVAGNGRKAEGKEMGISSHRKLLGCSGLLSCLGTTTQSVLGTHVPSLSTVSVPPKSSQLAFVVAPSPSPDSDTDVDTEATSPSPDSDADVDSEASSASPPGDTDTDVDNEASSPSPSADTDTDTDVDTESPPSSPSADSDVD